MLRKPVLLVLREDGAAIDHDVEDSAGSRHERGVERELAGDRGCQTGGLWTIVSPHAIDDGDPHEGNHTDALHGNAKAAWSAFLDPGVHAGVPVRRNVRFRFSRKPSRSYKLERPVIVR